MCIRDSRSLPLGDVAHHTRHTRARAVASSLFNCGIQVDWSGLPASGKGNWDQPKHTTYCGLSLSENPTYSAFRSVFGATCLRMQRLASTMGFGTTARLGPRKNLPWTGRLSSGNAWADVAAPGDGAHPGGAGKRRLAGSAKPNIASCCISIKYYPSLGVVLY